jgi:DNA-binding PadR family transcriptional regulator
MEKTEKLHVLAILENGLSMDLSQIRIVLQKDFCLKPNVEALWKNLQRCTQQRLISVEKAGRNNFYTITEKGKKRRRIIAARKETEFKEWLAGTFRKDQAKKVQVVEQKPTTSALMKRAFEVNSSLVLCDAVLSSIHDETTLNFAGWTKTYWQNEKNELIPYITEDQANAIDRLSRRFAESLGKILK